MDPFTRQTRVLNIDILFIELQKLEKSSINLCVMLWLIGKLSPLYRGLRSRMPFPGYRIFPPKNWEISRPEHSGTSSSRSQLSPVIRDWLLPGLVLGQEI